MPGRGEPRPAALASYKLQLLASMSHELIPPVQSLLARAKLLAEDPDRALDRQQAEYVATIARAGADLLTLVNEIVDLAAIDDDEITISPRDVRLPEIIDVIDRSFRPRAESKQISYTTELRVGLPARLHTDPRRLQQALLDLLANALAFTEQGSITLRIHRPDPGTRFSNVALEQRMDAIAFSVLDTGRGIATSAPHLDLSVSRQIARLLGGEVHVENDPEVGIAFTLYVPERTPAADAPAADPDPGRRPPPRPIAVRTAAHGRKVLVIDGDVRSTFAVTGVLEAHGHDVVYADRLEEGREAIARQPDVDLVLVDLKTCADGYGALRALRAEPALRRKPIVAVGDPPLTAPLTPAALALQRRACLDAGASDYLPKPIDTATLLDLLRAGA